MKRLLNSQLLKVKDEDRCEISAGSLALRGCCVSLEVLHLGGAWKQTSAQRPGINLKGQRESRPPLSTLLWVGVGGQWRSGGPHFPVRWFGERWEPPSPGLSPYLFHVLRGSCQ